MRRYSQDKGEQIFKRGYAHVSIEHEMERKRPYQRPAITGGYFMPTMGPDLVFKVFLGLYDIALFNRWWESEGPHDDEYESFAKVWARKAWLERAGVTLFE